jgi:short-subunit dehydrogenase
MSKTSGRPASVVLITGGSSGIGAEFARAYGARGRNVVLVARREDRMRTLAAELAAAHAIQADYIVCDLGAAGSGQQLYDEVARRGYLVDTLINNAGFGIVGPRFDETPLPRALEMVQVNVAVLVELTGLYLPEMRARGRGAIINVASTAAFQPIAHIALYAASKAFVLNFTLGVWAETRGTCVRVLALCPGDTNTEWGAVAGGQAPQTSHSGLPARAVVQAALRALAHDAGYVVVAPPLQRVFKWLVKVVPRKLVARATARMFR